MPYIEKKRRAVLDQERKMGQLMTMQSAGELNYVITQLIKNYLMMKRPLNYQTINDIIGALEGAKLEFVRRVVNSYEDEKIKTNGDCY